VSEISNGKVTTSHGCTVIATSAVVLATNSPINKNLLVHPRQSAQRSYVIGFKVPPSTSIKDVQFWDTNEPYHYVRLASHAGGFTPGYKSIVLMY
jgi:hypothetical protein